MSKTKTIKTKKKPKNIALEQLYQNVRSYRTTKRFSLSDLEKVFETLIKNHKNDWLLQIELLELAEDRGLILKIKKHLAEIVQNKPELGRLIESGIRLI